MPTVSAAEDFLIQSGINQCWDFVSSLKNVGYCIPGCESVTQIDSNTANFKVKLRVGYISRTLDLRAKILQARAPNHFAFMGQGVDAEISGAIDLSPQGMQTRLTYKIEIVPISVTGKTAVTMMGKDLVKKQAREFAACVRSKLEEK